MKEKRFLNAEDVAEYMDISIPTAYRIIRGMNKDLNERGFITIAGKINRNYFEEKVYSLAKTGGDDNACA